jgi:thiosulfate/3-mercaptopyruvate sulfurtransferase
MDDMIGDLLVSPKWLSDHKNDENIVIVDCVYDQNAYTRAHIPDAIMRLGSPYIKSIGADEKPKLHVPTPAEFDKLVEKIGIGPETTVICYDEWGSYWATRFWWVLRYYGHTNTKILNGGWQSWVSAGFPITYKTTNPSPVSKPFESQPHEQYIITQNQLLKDYNSPNWLLIDTRTADEYNGKASRSNKRLGHVPGAIHLEWKELIDNAHNKEAVRVFRPPEDLERIFSNVGITRDKTVVTYCQSAVRATITAFALELLGFPDVRVYDGSMKEWANNDNMPLD